MSSRQNLCLLSVDVEDWFHLVGVGLDYQFNRPHGGIASWETRTCRVDYNTRWILDLLDEYQDRATFFVLGWVAERFPDLVLEIHRRGHEVASHSYWHRIVYRLTPEEFRQDLRRSIDVLQDITGCKVHGFRASTASITDWAVDIIAEEGLTYDSSLFPVAYHDVYGRLTGTRNDLPIERLSNGLWEVKLSSLRLGGKYIPWSGGGYFRWIPYPLFRWGVRKIWATHGVFQFFIHPWELDNDPPVLQDLRPMYKFRRYMFIHKTRPRFRRLLGDFKFVPVFQGLTQFRALWSRL